ncbi:probable LRR receptor-like serine/threonine-protein kinase At4g37250 [Neltuma alba]|uniref:probable LRR receptor-like serine/threonine-protein kinase At4g37250 n=1 Tax=Neltuma alba TaxID=207710 RepID=UPI0010A57753|nr:probable LRR receptor-like serine/threonine-protein kinase At4g37250 [Prosopis alba]
MSFSSLLWRFFPLVLLVIVAVNPCFGLNRDGVLLLSLKYSVWSDPLFLLGSWNYLDQTPCSWKGVTCRAVSDATNSSSQDRVVGLALPNSQLLGSIPNDLGMIENLQRLDLSNNSLNGSLPSSLFQASKLGFLDLSNNLISGEIPDSIVQLRNLQVLDLSDNALAGKLPASLGNMQNLTVVSVRNNYLSGGLPSGFRTTQVLDLSSNLLNGSLPSDFGGDSLRLLNISFNQFSGEIPKEFARKIPSSATVDLSFNNLTGEIPDSSVFINHDLSSFSGNPDLCGEGINNPCPASSSPAPSPNATSPTSPPAFAAFPKTLDSPPPGSGHGTSQQNKTGLRRGTIIGIVVGDIIGIGLLAMIFLYVYQLKRRKRAEDALNKEPIHGPSSPSSFDSRGFRRWSCLRKKTDEEEESSSESASSSDNEVDAQNGVQRQESSSQNKTGTLVTVDGEKEMEPETLLKASAFILGATGSSIMYKAVLEDGTALAVRRIGESGVGRFKDFEAQVRVVAKLVHPNLVRVRGFYWGNEEKLIIYDFVPNGSLANVRYRKVGSSPCHVPWELRLKIAKGVARGLAYLHDKKHVHGNLKPSNILLGNDMEPRIGDFGLEKIVTGDASYKAGGSARIFGSKRSTASRDSFQDINFGPSPSPSPSSITGVSPYHAPESYRNLKPHPKWDVFSFGIIFLELLTGKIVVTDEMGQGTGVLVEDKNRALRMADVAIRADMEGKEEALLAYFRLGYSCVSSVPQKRPSMKEVLYALDKITCSFSSSSMGSFYHGH